MTPDKGERVVAAFEGAKGLLVLLVGFGLLRVLNEDVQRLAEELVRALHLNPAKRLPRIFLDAAERHSDVHLWMLAVFAFGYAVLRFAEAFGLWFGKRWAEWFAVASGAFYIPFEVYALWERATWLRAATLAANVAIVAYVGFMLWRRVHGRRRGLPASS